ncbi:hypothetical protein [Lentibacter sp. XHP0401]|jgi:uncharacterized protein YjiS (DUF1127 family)|uniref:hypothetical protein n=1 Tax=Lentibacter sp. XHP0401 TaxID=2984334 RepID=UPI0021E87DBD|nr:hypothetical protein [Lentibacter sp. XHP0401]MCV2894608.1 hypothetical protein [Lentibacter sp. XHP0401]
MAYTTLTTVSGFRLTGVVSYIKTGFSRWIDNIEAQRIEPYRVKIAALHALSDEELAQKGLARDEIEQRVLSRFFYC